MNQSSRSMGRLIKVVHNKSGLLDRDQVMLACTYLKTGGVVALPTDTIYGLAALADDSKALDKIYQIKGRDLSKPLSVCIKDYRDLGKVSDQKLPERVLQSLLPGPITILLQRGQQLNKDLNPGVETIGVRVPNHNFIRAIAAEVGPIALTSANISGESSPIKAEEFETLWSLIDCVFDCGVLKRSNFDDAPYMQRLGSTVVDLSVPNSYKIIREGCALNRTISLLNRFGYRNRDRKKPTESK